MKDRQNEEGRNRQIKEQKRKKAINQTTTTKKKKKTSTKGRNKKID